MNKFTAKLGNMRQPADFTIYPIQQDDTTILLQSAHRMARIQIASGSGVLSQAVANYPNSQHLYKEKGAMDIQLNPEQFEALKEAAKGRGKTISIGGGVMIADNPGIIQL